MKTPLKAINEKCPDCVCGDVNKVKISVDSARYALSIVRLGILRNTGNDIHESVAKSLRKVYNNCGIVIFYLRQTQYLVDGGIYNE